MNIKNIALGVLFLAALGIAGNYDRAEEVISGMPAEAYQAITAKLGASASIIDIADEYLKNREEYDSLAK